MQPHRQKESKQVWGCANPSGFPQVKIKRVTAAKFRILQFCLSFRMEQQAAATSLKLLSAARGQGLPPAAMAVKVVELKRIAYDPALVPEEGSEICAQLAAPAKHQNKDAAGHAFHAFALRQAGHIGELDLLRMPMLLFGANRLYQAVGQLSESCYLRSLVFTSCDHNPLVSSSTTLQSSSRVACCIVDYIIPGCSYLCIIAYRLLFCHPGSNVQFHM